MINNGLCVRLEHDTISKLFFKKKLMPAWHTSKIRYMSSNKKVATVSKYGKIKARSTGSCKVCVYAHNGVKKTIKVTVK